MRDERAKPLPLELHGVWDGWGIVFDPIPFRCVDGTGRVRCWASLDALALLCAGEDLTALDDPDLAARFAEHLHSFVAIASFKHDTGKAERDGSIYVRAADMTGLAGT